jgi:enoyl-CoA hydratase/carnithine racemase
MISSTTKKLKLEVRGHTALVTIDNPSANTWDEESLGGLSALVDECTADKSIYAIVVTGNGEKFFSAGADLDYFSFTLSAAATIRATTDCDGAAVVRLFDSSGSEIDSGAGSCAKKDSSVASMRSGTR